MIMNKTILSLISAIDAILEAENFCSTCKYNHPRLIPDQCRNCVAGNPIDFKYDRKELTTKGK